MRHVRWALTLALITIVSACGDDSPASVVGGTGATTTGGGDTVTGATGGTVGTADDGSGTGGDVGTGTSDDGTGTGPECDCDDGIACTKDVCHADGSCDHLLETGPECKPTIGFTKPKRGTWMQVTDSVQIEGTALSNLGDGTLSFAGVPIPSSPDGSFSTELLLPTHGVNMFVAEITDSVGTARAVQSFLMGEVFYDTLDGPKGSALVDNGLVVFLGAEMWDDDDLSDLDDVATVVHRALEGIDVVSLIPNPLTSEGEGPGLGWCSWTVTVSDVRYDVDWVDVKTIKDGLELSGMLSNIEVDFLAVAPAFACPDAGGTASAADASLSVTVMVKLNPDATVQVDVDEAAIEVIISELEFDITEGVGSAFDFLFNWFDGTVSGFLEAAIKDVLINTIAPLVSQLLEGITTLQQDLVIPPFPGGSKSVTATLSVVASYLSVDTNGAVLGLAVSATTPKAASWLEAAGSLARHGCFDGVEPPLEIDKDQAVSISLHDDVLNQALFAAWWGGVLNVKVEPELISILLPDVPLTGLTVTLDPRLPPIVTSCIEPGETHLQIGDMRVLATFEFEGKPGAVEAYVTASFNMSLNAEKAEGATIAIGFKVDNVEFLDFHIVDATGSIAGAENLLNLLLRNVIRDLIVQSLGSDVFNAFPVPQFDLSAFIPGLPTNTVLSFDPTSVSRSHGYVVLGGQVAQ